MDLYNKTSKEKIAGYNQPVAAKGYTSQTGPEDYLKEYMNFMADLPTGYGSKPEIQPTEKEIIDKPFEENYVRRRTQGFTNLNLSDQNQYNNYINISQKYIDTRNPNAGVTGEMLARGAKLAFDKTGTYVPPELALAQLTQEGGLSEDPRVKPRRTKNPFNVGNVNSGAVKIFSSIQEGINKYFDLISTQYLGKGRNAEDLLDNFVNHAGHRYAVNDKDPKLKDYEEALKPLISKIHNMST